MEIKIVLLLVLSLFFNQMDAKRDFFVDCPEITEYDFCYLFSKDDTLKINRVAEFNRLAFLSNNSLKINGHEYYVWYPPTNGATKKNKMIKTDATVFKDYLRMESNRLFYSSDFILASKDLREKELVLLSFSGEVSIVSHFGIVGLESFTTELESVLLIKTDSVFKFKISNFTYGASNYPWILKYLFVSKNRGIVSYVYENGNGPRLLITRKH